MSSCPLSLDGVATQTRRDEQTRLTITSTRAEQAKIQAVLVNLAKFLNQLKSTAKQLTGAQRLRQILSRTSAKLMLPTRDPSTLLNV